LQCRFFVGPEGASEIGQNRYVFFLLFKKQIYPTGRRRKGEEKKEEGEGKEGVKNASAQPFRAGAFFTPSFPSSCCFFSSPFLFLPVGYICFLESLVKRF